MTDARLPEGTLAALRVAKDRGDDLALGQLPGAVRLRPRPGDAPITVEHDNSLVDVDAALTLPALWRLCHARGFMLPVARPLPPMTVQEACARLPVFAEAFVASATLVLTSGESLETPRAPRAAIGPDLLGALTTTPPIALCVRARVRVIPGRAARVHEARYVSAREAAHHVAAVVDEGRALSVDASRAGPGDFLVLTLGGSGALPHVAEEPETPRFAHRAAVRVRGGSLLIPGDERSMAETLSAGGRVLASPIMGRAGTLDKGARVPRVVPTDVAVEQLAAALARGEGERDGG